ncbi:MAG: hypothetical protein ACI9F9_000127 [Candidatus Paceibacteria bacterium]|jgi:hypothetical protein
MTSRVQMDDIQFRLEAIKKQLPSGGPAKWKLSELIDDCASLRLADPKGEFVGALEFIEQMLSMVLRNMRSMGQLKKLRRQIAE